MKGFTFIEMMIVITIVVSRFGYSQDSLELDLDAMWDQAIWEEVEDVTTEVFEVEYVTAVAGVRGAEAEDEALAHLYYRKSMRGLQKEDLERAYGKLMNKRSLIIKNNPNSLELKKIETYLLQIKQRINS